MVKHSYYPCWNRHPLQIGPILNRAQSDYTEPDRSMCLGWFGPARFNESDRHSRNTDLERRMRAVYKASSRDCWSLSPYRRRSPTRISSSSPPPLPPTLSHRPHLPLFDPSLLLCEGWLILGFTVRGGRAAECYSGDGVLWRSRVPFPPLLSSATHCCVTVVIEIGAWEPRMGRLWLGIPKRSLPSLFLSRKVGIGMKLIFLRVNVFFWFFTVLSWFVAGFWPSLVLADHGFTIRSCPREEGGFLTIYESNFSPVNK